MKEYTEYHSGLEWPEGDHVEWEFNHNRKWTPTVRPQVAWNNGNRVRFHIPEVKTRKQFAEEYANKNPGPYVMLAFQAFIDGWEAKTNNPEVE